MSVWWCWVLSVVMWCVMLCSVVWCCVVLCDAACVMLVCDVCDIVLCSAVCYVCCVCTCVSVVSDCVIVIVWVMWQCEYCTSVSVIVSLCCMSVAWVLCGGFVVLWVVLCCVYIVETYSCFLAHTQHEEKRNRKNKCKKNNNKLCGIFFNWYKRGGGKIFILN